MSGTKLPEMMIDSPWEEASECLIQINKYI